MLLQGVAEEQLFPLVHVDRAQAAPAELESWEQAGLSEMDSVPRIAGESHTKDWAVAGDTWPTLLVSASAIRSISTFAFLTEPYAYIM